MDDPKSLTASWTEDWVMRVRPEWEKVGLYEFVCQENNQPRAPPLISGQSPRLVASISWRALRA
ncbi:MAG: hypothetical protein HY657_19885 [Acidobacteria bacterium]|nr:hypothetical protein [Acidobacteriota bacterium]